MNCPHCSFLNRENARFCIQCGTRLIPDGTPATGQSTGPDQQKPSEIVSPTPPSIPEEKTGVPALSPDPDQPATGPAQAVPAEGVTVSGSDSPASTGDAALPSPPERSTPAAVETAPPMTGPEQIPAGTEKPTIPSPPARPEQTEVGSGAPDPQTGPPASPSPESYSNQTPPGAVPGQAATAVTEPGMPPVGGTPESNRATPSTETAELEQPLPAGELTVGTILQDRFEILGVLSSQSGQTLYEARDHTRCWQCGHQHSGPGDRFCIACGAELTPEQQVCHLQESFSAPDEIPEKALAYFEQNKRWYIALSPEEPLPKMAQAPVTGLRLMASQASHPGQVREQDEDSVLALTCNAIFKGHASPNLGLYAVADGMGGEESGEIASQMALQVLGEWVINHVIVPEVKGDRCLESTAVERLTEAVQHANGDIFLGRHQAGNEMGTTLTAALILRDKAIVVNVGDSRTYLWRDGTLKQITTDHSAVARLVEAGEIQPDEIYTHPQRATIYRSLGDKPSLEKVDSFIETLSPGDRLLLCCDGIWESLRPEGLEEIMLTWPTDPHHAAAEIIKRANQAGGEDNLSIIVVAVEGS